MQRQGISQNPVISSFNEFVAMHEEMDLSLNRRGVCLAASMSFALMHLLPESDGQGPQFFENFFRTIGTVEGVKDFFQGYEDLTEQYQQAHLKGDFWAQERVQKQLIPYWNGLALINLMLIVYAEREYLETPPTEEGGDQPVAINGVEGTINPKTLEFAGLKIDGAMSCHISYRELEEFFLGRATLFSSQIAPFKKGGTYLLALPHHACAVHVTLDGTLKFYDPNNEGYLSTPEEISSYKDTLVSYVRSSEKDVYVPIDVFSVSLLTGDLKDKKRKDNIQQRLNRATNNLLKKHFEPIYWQKMLLQGHFRTLFYAKTSLAQSLLSQTLQYCESHGVYDFWDKIDRHADLSQPLIVEMFYAVHKVRNFEILKISYAHEKLAPWLNRTFNIIHTALMLKDFELLSHVVALTPLEHVFSENMIQSISSMTIAGEHEALQAVVHGLLRHKSFKSHRQPSVAVLDFIHRFFQDDVFAVVLKIWAKYEHELGRSSAYQIDGCGVIEWLVSKKSSKELVYSILTTGYTLTDKDYAAILQYDDFDLKKALLDAKMGSPFWEQTAVMEQLLLNHDHAFIKELIKAGKRLTLSPRASSVLCHQMRKADFTCAELLFDRSHQLLVINTTPKNDYQKEIAVVELLRNISRGNNISEEESIVLGDFIDELLTKNPESFQAIKNYALKHQLPIHKACLSHGELLVKKWIGGAQWDFISAFWSLLNNLNFLSKKDLMQLTVDVCEKEDAPIDWPRNLVESAHLSWDDFLPEHQNMVDILYHNRHKKPSSDVARFLMQNPSLAYSESILNCFTTRLADLEKAESAEDFKKIIDDLTHIKELIVWSQAAIVPQLQYQYQAVVASIDEIEKAIPQLSIEDGQVRPLIETIFRKKLSVESPQPPTQQQGNASFLEYLWGLFAGRR